MSDGDGHKSKEAEELDQLRKWAHEVIARLKDIADLANESVDTYPDDEFYSDG